VLDSGENVLVAIGLMYPFDKMVDLVLIEGTRRMSQKVIDIKIALLFENAIKIRNDFDILSHCLVSLF
jgi:hypothetical protein